MTSSYKSKSYNKSTIYPINDDNINEYSKDNENIITYTTDFKTIDTDIDSISNITISNNPTPLFGIKTSFRLKDGYGHSNYNPINSQVSTEISVDNINDNNIGLSARKPIKDKPRLTTKKTIVDISFKINAISDIDSIRCIYSIDIKLFFHWNDETLIGKKKLTINELKELKSYPDLFITNANDLEQYFEGCKIADSETGRIKQTVAYRGKCFIVNMDLSYFPFDAQNLQICLRSHKLPIELIELRYYEDESAIDTHIEHEWKIYGFCAKKYKTLATASTTAKVYSSLHIITLIQRQSGWFVNNVMVVSFFLTLVNWTAFAFETTDIKERMDVCVLTMLASISNKFVVGDRLPKIQYRTLLDQYLDVCFASQLFTILSNVLVNHYGKEKKEEYPPWPWLGRHLNSFLLYFIVICFGSFNIYIVIKIIIHDRNVNNWRNHAQGIMKVGDSHKIFNETKSSKKAVSLKHSKASIPKVIYKKAKDVIAPVITHVNSQINYLIKQNSRYDFSTFEVAGHITHRDDEDDKRVTIV